MFCLPPKSENHNLFAIMELPLNMGRRMQLNTCNTGTDTVHISPLGITASSGLQGKSRQKQQLQQEKNLTIFYSTRIIFFTVSILIPFDTILDTIMTIDICTILTVVLSPSVEI